MFYQFFLRFYGTWQRAVIKSDQSQAILVLVRYCMHYLTLWIYITYFNDYVFVRRIITCFFYLFNYFTIICSINLSFYTFILRLKRFRIYQDACIHIILKSYLYCIYITNTFYIEVVLIKELIRLQVIQICANFVKNVQIDFFLN